MAGRKKNIMSLSDVANYNIPVLRDTVFDVFGGIPQAFVGISGEAGAGKTQVLMKLIADIARTQPVIVVLTEQSPHRWKALFNKYETETNPRNIKVSFKYYLDSDFIKELGKAKEKVIIIDSISGAVNEQKARQIAKELRGLVEWNNKWLIGSFQVRKDGIAGGEGVEHMIEVLYELVYFQLKPQNKWLYDKLTEFGYEVGDYVRLIRNTYDKIRGVQNTNFVVVDLDSETGKVEFLDIGKKEMTSQTSSATEEVVV